METNQSNTESPLQYDDPRDVLNTPPPSLITNTNLVIVSLIAIMVLASSLIDIPVVYKSPVEIISFSSEVNKFEISNRNSTQIVEVVKKDRSLVNKGDHIFTIKMESELIKILAPIDGNLLFSKTLVPGRSFMENEPIAWISSNSLIPTEIELQIKSTDISYFIAGKEITLIDQNNRQCRLLIREIESSRSAYNVRAKIVDGDVHFDFKSAQLNIQLEGRTLLEQLMQKK